MNTFDSLKINAFNVVTRVMGYDAVWVSSESGVTYKARVGYKDPSQAEKLSGIDTYQADRPYMEYHVGDFPGLKYAADRKLEEVITIYDTDTEGTQYIRGVYSVAEIVTKSDGDTYVVTLIRE